MEKVDLELEKDNAIVIENAHKSYGRKYAPVLNNLNLEVQRGKIYGLLGPSGCGKTTLLKCMVGKLKLDSGKVLVFGRPPGSRFSGVPGSRVGYMPQELAMFEEFNIEETLRYFSRIYGMSNERFQTRLSFLMKFLDLPSKSRALEKMSGGQQRRASLAVALLHQPQLLILDEPTVGVDPLLRQSIWEHLIKLTESGEEATTVIITTHYTEEAMQAHRVGMLRNGRLLAEDTPTSLLTAYNKPGLEEVFLHLCHQDGGEDSHESSALDNDKKDITAKLIDNDKSHSLENGVNAFNNGVKPGINGVNGVNGVNNGVDHNNLIVSSQKQEEKQKIKSEVSEVRVISEYQRARFSPRVVSACMIKTFKRMSKRWGFLIYQFLLPALQVSLFCLAIGQDPKHLPVSIVSKEVPNGEHCDSFSLECPVDFGIFPPVSQNQHLANLSCRFLSFLSNETILPVWHTDRQSAIESVERGESWGVVYMDYNFSQAIYSKMESVGSAVFTDISISNRTEDPSNIQIQLDVTNQQIAFTLQLKLAEAFQLFVAQLASSCGYSPEMAELPLDFQEPIYGDHTLTFTDFMAPGIILTIVHSMALGYSAMTIIIERNEGLLDRTWVAGVTFEEFSLAHFLVSISVNIVQVVLTLVFMVAVFEVPVEGSYFLLFFLTLGQGMCGITIGLIISSVCKTQQDATQIALGIFYPNMLLSGILWPLEAMPVALRYISYALPQTLACEAMRAILLRGWGITHPLVYRGFIATLVWTLATYLIFRLKIARSH